MLIICKDQSLTRHYLCITLIQTMPLETVILSETTVLLETGVGHVSDVSDGVSVDTRGVTEELISETNTH